MIGILHLLDGTVGWEQRLGLIALLERLPQDKCHQHVAALAGFEPGELPGRDVPVIPYFRAIWPLSARSLSSHLDKLGIDIVHAWGPAAAMVANLSRQKPVVLQLFDPLLVSKNRKIIRELSQQSRFAAACSAGLVRRRLIEGGVDAAKLVLIRPGIDFSALSKVRRSGLRESLGVSRDECAILTLATGTDQSGAFKTALAATVLNNLQVKVRLIVPSESPKRLTMQRRFKEMPGGDCVIFPPPTPFEELIAISDLFVTASTGDSSSTSIAVAMAANVAVVGSATYAVAELITHRVNGILFKRPVEKGLVSLLARALREREALDRFRQAAHGQAFAAFGLRRFVEQNLQLYENLMGDRPASTGIGDSAVA